MFLFFLDVGSGLSVVGDGSDQCTDCVAGGLVDMAFSINLNQLNGMGGEKNFKAYMKVKQANNGDYGEFHNKCCFLMQSRANVVCRLDGFFLRA